MFVQTGKDLFLDVQKPVNLQQGSDFQWKHNGSSTIAKSFGNMTFNYKERAELFIQNYSLLLKNVQKTDSGDYIARVSGVNDDNVAEYQVTVQGKFLNI